MKVAAAHHPIIQKDVNELLSEGVIEPSSGGARFYSSVFVVAKHTGGLWPYLTLSSLIIICICSSFKIAYSPDMSMAAYPVW